MLLLAEVTKFVTSYKLDIAKVSNYTQFVLAASHQKERISY